ncbi:MAG: fibronectin type III domain-containing protein, partial [Acidimicrobiaceae bacterium]|nr:fibronectin type III domain-containing protein [Acidimicrobiaceae bacterium]
MCSKLGGEAEIDERSLGRVTVTRWLPRCRGWLTSLLSTMLVAALLAAGSAPVAGAQPDPPAAAPSLTVCAGPSAGNDCAALTSTSAGSQTFTVKGSGFTSVGENGLFLVACLLPSSGSAADIDHHEDCDVGGLTPFGSFIGIGTAAAGSQDLGGPLASSAGLSAFVAGTFTISSGAFSADLTVDVPAGGMVISAVDSNFSTGATVDVLLSTAPALAGLSADDDTAKQVTLSWTEPDACASASPACIYQVRYKEKAAAAPDPWDWTAATTTSSTASGVTTVSTAVTGLGSGVEYGFEVQALQGASGSEEGVAQGSVSAATLDVPLAPVLTLRTTTFAGSISHRLAWTATTDTTARAKVTRWLIEISEDGDDWSHGADFVPGPLGRLVYSFTGLLNVKIFARVRAVSAAGNSEPSNVVPVPPPTELVLSVDRSPSEADDTSTTDVEEHKATLTATLNRPALAAVTVTLAVDTTESTATAVTDYTLSSATVTIAKGATTGTATITAVDDSHSEGLITVDRKGTPDTSDDTAATENEKIVIGASSTSPALTAAPVTVRIVDDEPAGAVLLGTQTLADATGPVNPLEKAGTHTLTVAGTGWTPARLGTILGSPALFVSACVVPDSGMLTNAQFFTHCDADRVQSTQLGGGHTTVPGSQDLTTIRSSGQCALFLVPAMPGTVAEGAKCEDFTLTDGVFLVDMEVNVPVGGVSVGAGTANLAGLTATIIGTVSQIVEVAPIADVDAVPTSDSVTLTWSNETFCTSTTPACTYWVRHKKTADGDNGWSTWTNTGWSSGATGSYTVTSLDADTGYDFELERREGTGQSQVTLNEASVSATVQAADTGPVGVSVSTAAVEAAVGASVTYSVVLDSAPSADVVVSVSSSDSGVAAVRPATLTFTAADWETPQPVSVSGEGSGSASVSHSVASSDARYRGLSVDQVGVRVALWSLVNVTGVDLSLNADALADAVARARGGETVGDAEVPEDGSWVIQVFVGVSPAPSETVKVRLLRSGLGLSGSATLTVPAGANGVVYRLRVSANDNVTGDQPYVFGLDLDGMPEGFDAWGSTGGYSVDAGAASVEVVAVDDDTARLVVTGRAGASPGDTVTLVGRLLSSRSVDVGLDAGAPSSVAFRDAASGLVLRFEPCRHDPSPGGTRCSLTADRWINDDSERTAEVSYVVPAAATAGTEFSFEFMENPGDGAHLAAKEFEGLPAAARVSLAGESGLKTMTVTGSDAVEGDSSKPLSLSLGLDPAAPAATEVAVALIHGRSSSPADIAAPAASASFGSGDAAAVWQVATADDTLVEPREALVAVATAPAGYTDASGPRTLTIVDDDRAELALEACLSVGGDYANCSPLSDGDTMGFAGATVTYTATLAPVGGATAVVPTRHSGRLVLNAGINGNGIGQFAFDDRNDDGLLTGDELLAVLSWTSTGRNARLTVTPTTGVSHNIDNIDDAFALTGRTHRQSVTGLAVASGDQQLTATWTWPQNQPSVDGWRIRWRDVTNNGAWTEPAIVGATALTHTITGLTNDTTYGVQVAPYASGDTYYSGTRGTPRQPPAAPDAPTVSRGDGGELVAEWQAPSDDGGPAVTGWQLRHSKDGNDWTDVSGTVTGKR